MTCTSGGSIEGASSNWRRRLPTVALLVVIASSCSSDGTSPVDVAEPTTPADENVEAAVEDDDLPVEQMESFYVRFESARAMAASADVVAVVTLAEIEPDVFELLPTAEGPQVTLLYEGLVFTVDRLIKGNGETTVTVRTPTLLVGADGGPISRMAPDHPPIGASDIGTSYLVFLSPALVDPSLVDPGLYDVETPDGVAMMEAGVVATRERRDKKDPLAAVVGKPPADLAELLELDR